MTAITLETIKARQDELAAMIADKSRTINLPAATIELRPDEQYAGLVLKDDGTPLHHLVRMAEQTTNPLSWQDATAWASKAGVIAPIWRTTFRRESMASQEIAEKHRTWGASL